MAAIAATIALELKVRTDQVERVIELLDAGSTIPFIARYRKEVTGSLDEEQLRQIQARLAYLRSLDERKQTALKSIGEQGKLTPELEQAIQSASTLQQVEDLYLPYKPKRRTRAMMARERGLQPLADMMLAQELTHGTPEEHAAPFVSPEVPTPQDALAGARDIVAETVAEDAEVRAALRKLMLEQGILSSSAKEGADAEGKYQLYHEYAEPVRAVPPHRLLAINRGEKEGVLQVKIEAPEGKALFVLQSRYLHNSASVFQEQVDLALADAYERLLQPAIERDIRRSTTVEAESRAIQVFATNLRHLLLQSPLRGVRVMGVDPGYRTGCKVAVIDEFGKFLEGVTIYPHPPQEQWNDSLRTLRQLVERHKVNIVAIGNGTASRETEKLVSELIDRGAQVSYAMVSEAGASVYSASPLARQEFPDLDVSMRGAVSIARRLQDPLAELVKIDPRSIGVGLYQHDVTEKELVEALDGVVESVVNYVGVDVNTASPALLEHVAGLNSAVARAIVERRNLIGPFRSRDELREVRGLGARTFQQAAGFLRVPNAANPLDKTGIHPESYPVVANLFELMGVTGNEPDLPDRVRSFRASHSIETLADVLGVGVPTLIDVLDDLVKPGRDPREELPGPILRQDVLSMDDLREGMVLTGTVRNVVDFGAFVDIGVKQDGLVHLSEMGERYVRDPYAVVSVGDIVQVRIIQIDRQRGRIGLSMKGLHTTGA